LKGTKHPLTTAVGTLKWYSKTLEYEYRVKTAALGTLKQYSIFSLTLYLEYRMLTLYPIVTAPLAKQRKKSYNSQAKNPN
jgi:hypothetical protein